MLKRLYIMLKILYINNMKKNQLSYYEKRSILSILVLLTAYGGMYYSIFNYYRTGLQHQDLTDFWGSQFLELFLCLIFIYTLSILGFNTVNKKVTGEARPKITDERDVTIELKAVHGSFYTLALGVFLAMLAGFWAETYSPIYLIVVSSFFVSGIVADVIRIVLYRKSS